MQLTTQQRQWLQMKEQAQVFIKSGFLPRAIRSPEQALAVITMGKELGLQTWQSFREIHIINGTPAIGAKLMLGLIYQKHPECVISYEVMTPQQCTIKAARKEGSGQPLSTFTFTWQDAQNAQLTGKDNWRKYPQDMLRNRCISKLARSLFPDVVMGLYTDEEIESFNDTPKHVEKPVQLPPVQKVNNQPIQQQETIEAVGVDPVQEPVDNFEPPTPEPLPNVQEQPGQTQTNAVSEPQLKRLFALIRGSKTVTIESFRELMVSQFGVVSTKNLSLEQYNSICNMLESTQERALQV